MLKLQTLVRKNQTCTALNQDYGKPVKTKDKHWQLCSSRRAQWTVQPLQKGTFKNEGSKRVVSLSLLLSPDILYKPNTSKALCFQRLFLGADAITFWLLWLLKLFKTQGTQGLPKELLDVFYFHFSHKLLSHVLMDIWRVGAFFCRFCEPSWNTFEKLPA